MINDNDDENIADFSSEKVKEFYRKDPLNNLVIKLGSDELPRYYFNYNFNNGKIKFLIKMFKMFVCTSFSFSFFLLFKLLLYV